MALKITTRTETELHGFDGRALFIDGKLAAIRWHPVIEADQPAPVHLDPSVIHSFPQLMRFLREVEKAQLEIEYRTQVLVSNSGHGEVQLWFQKPENGDFQGSVEIGAQIYEDRFGIKPNVLILNDKDDSDVRFWRGKIRRVHWLLPIHFRLTYQVEDAEEIE